MSKEKPTTKICKHCKTDIPYDAKICPQCRKKQGPSGCLTAIIIVAAFVIIGSFLGGKGNNASETASNTPTKAETTTAKEITQESTNAPETTADNIPTEYKSALKSAKTYSDSMHMSKSGIFDQLTSEYGGKFTSEAAQYAIDNLVADWNANALSNAKTYSDSMHMSKAAIYDQLISEYGAKFTSDEAQYAVDNLDADWNLNALESAKTYQSTMNMSPAAIHDQLTSEYGGKFTQEEADYAIANLD